MNTLTHFGTLKVSGLDAEQFLQGQLTNDIRELSPNIHQLSAFCNRQGRVLALLDTFKLHQNYFLTLPQELIPTIKPLLEKFIVAAKVKIEDVSQDYTITVNQDFLLTQMRAHIPFIGLAQTGQFLPHPLGLVDMGIVSFKKGCFVGQEIIARMQHRSTNTKALRYLEIEQDHMPTEHPDGIIVNRLEIKPKTYALLIIFDSKILYNT